MNSCYFTWSSKLRLHLSIYPTIRSGHCPSTCNSQDVIVKEGGMPLPSLLLARHQPDSWRAITNYEVTLEPRITPDSARKRELKSLTLWSPISSRLLSSELFHEKVNYFFSGCTYLTQVVVVFNSVPVSQTEGGSACHAEDSLGSALETDVCRREGRKQRWSERKAGMWYSRNKGLG